jgi:hypothetical protein
MSLTVATYIGFVVAILILTWGAIAIGRRYGGGRKKIRAQEMNTWVSLKPTSASVAKDPLSEAQDALEEDLSQDLHRRAQQNGHYSESKKNL